MEHFIYWVRAFQIPIGGVIVNQVMPPDSLSSFIVNKQAQQKKYLELVDKKFGDLVAARIPLFDGEIRGVEMLKKVII